VLLERVLVAQVLIANGAEGFAQVHREVARARAAKLKVGVTATAIEAAVPLDRLQLLIRTTKHGQGRELCNTTSHTISPLPMPLALNLRLQRLSHHFLFSFWFFNHLQSGLSTFFLVLRLP